MIRVGLVDFDTSHVVAFTQRLNHIDVGQSECVDGAKVVAGCPGESQMMPERIPGYTEQLKKYGIEIVDRPSDLIGRIDAVMIESQQGSRHLERARPFLEARIPAFIDKPFAEDVRQADALIELARKRDTPVMSCSALRYDPLVREALSRKEKLGSVVSAYAWTPATQHPGNPGLLHYGIHGVEMLYALLGPGCQKVSTSTKPQEEIVVGAWTNGRYGVLRGDHAGQGGMGLTAHYEKGTFTGVVEGAAFYREMLKQIVAMFTTRKEPIDLAETREIIAFCDAARSSAERSGASVELPRTIPGVRG